MANGFQLYLRYVALSFRAQMQYRASFVMLTVGVFFGRVTEFVGIWALFARFEALRGWTLAEVGLFAASSVMKYSGASHGRYSA